MKIVLIVMLLLLMTPVQSTKTIFYSQKANTTEYIKILKELNQTNEIGSSGFPVKKIIVSELAFNKNYGFATTTNIILLNNHLLKTLSYQQKKFVIAHELCHIQDFADSHKKRWGYQKLEESGDKCAGFWTYA